jgi:uncharacterized repeat protein (TIGR01451 family)
MSTLNPFRVIPVLIAVLFNLVAGPLAPLVTPLANTASASTTVTLEDGIEGCMGVRTTPGSENTTKELIGGTLEPGGTAIFRFTFPATVQGNPGQETWVLTDCVFLNGDPLQKYTVTALENDVSPVVIEFTLTIPADAPIGAEYCNYAKTTATPSEAQASNRKAGPACFVIGGALRVLKVNADTQAPLAGATFDVTCDWPDVTAGTFLPDTILSVPTNGSIAGGGSTETINSTDNGSFTRTVVTGDEGVISVNGPDGTVCTFTETAAPDGFAAPEPPDNTVTLTIDAGGGQVTFTFENTPLVPNLSIEKSTSTPEINAGEEASYTVTVTNSGSGDATGVTISDTLPTGLTWSEASDDCTITDGVLSCGPLTIAAGENFSVTLTGTTDAGECPSISNTASFDSDNAGSGDTTGSPTVIIVNCPDVSVAKTASSPVVVVGSTGTFTITASGGTEGTASDVTLTDTLPTGLTWTVGGDEIGDCSVDGTALVDGATVSGGDTIECNFGPLGPDETRSITVSATPDAGSCGASISNTATVAADGDTDTSNNSATAVFTVRCPTLVIEKAANVDVITISGPANAQTASPSTVTWTLTYTLTNGPVTNAVITDVVPTGFIFLSAANGGTLGADGKTITWNLGTLTASGSVSFVTTVDVATISRTGPTENVAVIRSDQTPSDEGRDSVRVTVIPPPLAGNPPKVPNTALAFGPGGQPVTVPIELLVVLFLGTLGGLAFANVRTVRRRRR